LDGQWLSRGDENLTNVKALLFESSGTPLGDSFQVNTFETGVQAWSAATFLADGSFVVVFESDPVTPSVFAVRARLFTAQGVPLGDDSLVSELAEGLVPEVVALSDGGFVVLYYALVINGLSPGLAVRHYGPKSTRWTILSTSPSRSCGTRRES